MFWNIYVFWNSYLYPFRKAILWLHFVYRANGIYHFISQLTYYVNLRNYRKSVNRVYKLTRVNQHVSVEWTLWTQYLATDLTRVDCWRCVVKPYVLGQFWVSDKHFFANGTNILCIAHFIGLWHNLKKRVFQCFQITVISNEKPLHHENLL